MSDEAAALPIESVWFVEVTYAPDAADARRPFRAEHIAGIQARLASGQYVEAGAFTDVSASVVIVRASTAQEAVALVADDVYMRNGVWVEVRARPFGRVRAAD